jgi:hypothetical protein
MIPRGPQVMVLENVVMSEDDTKSSMRIPARDTTRGCM